MRLDRLSPRNRRLAIASVAAAVGGVSLVSIVFPKPRAAAVASYESPSPTIGLTPNASPSSSGSDSGYYNDTVAQDPHRRTYALPLVELTGLSATSEPGSVFELWVAWDPSITEGPHVERLLERVRLESIISPPVPEGPYMVLISVKRNQVGDLIWGDTFGQLSAVMLP